MSAMKAEVEYFSIRSRSIDCKLYFVHTKGTSKTQAKNDASEKALRDLIIQKMVERPKKVASADGTDTMETEDVEMKEGESNSVEVPMMHLASFALHKLFSEWQNEGFEIPDLKSTNQQEKVVSGSEVNPM